MIIISSLEYILAYDQKQRFYIAWFFEENSVFFTQKIYLLQNDGNLIFLYAHKSGDQYQRFDK